MARILFSWAWVFLKRLWLIGVILLILIALIEFAASIVLVMDEAGSMEHWIVLIGWGIVSIAVGSNGNIWREKI